MKQGKGSGEFQDTRLMDLKGKQFRTNLVTVRILSVAVLLALPFCYVGLGQLSHWRLVAYPYCVFFWSGLLMILFSFAAMGFAEFLMGKGTKPASELARLLDYGLLSYLLIPGLCMGIFKGIFTGQTMLLGAAVVLAGALPVIKPIRLMVSLALYGVLLLSALLVLHENVFRIMEETILYLFFGLVSIYISKRRYSTFCRQVKQLKKMFEENRELVRLNEKLVLISETDPLTKLLNRRNFDDYAFRCWEECAKSGKTISMLMVDIDHFKSYNDLYGHMEGDRCLVRVSKVIKGLVPERDAAVFRYGGEEFVILLSQSGQDEGVRLATAIQKVIQELHIENKALKTGGYVTVSIGVCTENPDKGRNYKNVLRNADMALYEAKQCGRNRVVAALKSEK